MNLSREAKDGMIRYKGLPTPVVCDYLDRKKSREHYAEGTEFHIRKIMMVSNTGIYVDSPFHRYENGKDLSELPLGSLADLEAVASRQDVRGGPRGSARFPVRALGGRVVKSQPTQEAT